MGEDHFAGAVAARYDHDARAAGMFGPDALDAAVDLLAELARPGGRALELAVGTGRVALPLAERGIEVLGIDASPDMVDQLRAKPGGERIPVTIGDMATTRVGDHEFDLVFIVFNSILNLETQEGQVACFANAAHHLRPGGALVVEVVVPPWRRLPPGQRAVAFTVSERYVGFDEIDVVTQRAVSHHHVDRGDHVERTSMPFRYAWPSELDLMARLAGLALEQRWADWRRAPFTAESVAHVSIWRKARPE